MQIQVKTNQSKKQTLKKSKHKKNLVIAPFIQMLYQNLHSSQITACKEMFETFETRKMKMDATFKQLFKKEPKLSNLCSILHAHPDLLTKLIQEAMDWDIDVENKWWFFLTFFNMEELVVFCTKQKLSPCERKTKQSILAPSPFIFTLFQKEDYKLHKRMIKIVKEDKNFASVLAMRDPINEKTLLQLWPTSITGEDHYTDLFDLLVVSGVDLFNMHGSTALHAVVRKGNKTVIKKCLKAMTKGKCPLILQDDEQQNVLHVATSENNEEIVKYLLLHIEKKKNNCPSCSHMNDQDIDGFTPLHLAANLNAGNKKFTCYLSVAKLLVETKCDVNIQNQDGNTPLHDAYRQGSKDIIDLLIANGADVNIVNLKKQKPEKLQRPEVQNHKKKEERTTTTILL